MKLKTILAENVINETLNTDGVIKRTLVNQIYKQIGPITKGFFRDNAWQGIHKVF
ncbi:MAG: hypothetical protein HOK80_02225, partial [Candidatus Cloacimonetes bacterium]|nr:hypothetical protein [Candidatus Cloacimonadota bacterium]